MLFRSRIFLVVKLSANHLQTSNMICNLSETAKNVTIRQTSGILHNIELVRCKKETEMDVSKVRITGNKKTVGLSGGTQATIEFPI